MGKTCEMLLGEADAVLTPSYKGDSAHYFVEDIVRELKPTNLMGETKQDYRSGRIGSHHFVDLDSQRKP